MRIGIDLGGTKIEAIALDGHGNERARKRIASPRGDYAATIAAIRDLVAALETETGEQGTIGIGMPGAISPATGLVKNANSTWLIGHPFGRDLEESLGRKVRLANDADCFALSEATDGAAAGVASVFGVILGTGVGGGIVINGALLSGPNAIAGEWGHNSLPFVLPDEMPGPDCYCGKKGCIESWLSGPGFAADYMLDTREALSPEAIVAAAEGGNRPARLALRRYADRLARTLAHVINILDPHAIVLGGGMSNIDALYDEVPSRWGAYVFSDSVATPLLRHKHGDTSGVRGAAWLWPAW
ncbi:MAG: fructokinase [Parvibaculum sp.]|jgi:fructokinase|uniref:ROK family protein n=1 Tax=Parvibaculum sp. TaxID=2024848 RepID=UPI000C3630D4|nr:ROK family protein [Parvibaculum sp.]MAU59221.1 fructokinase [Parvibaculum sp.]|tara:strand:+ start:1616 stop:2515 length:900 start_codon:yes stop_codon:yes gene_type:complete